LKKQFQRVILQKMPKLPINQIICGDSLIELKKIPNDCIDSVVTDSPYNLNFMGKDWDRTSITFDISLWREVLRVLKPGSHLLSFGGTRTYHRMTCAVEDAGFEIRDCIMWVYGSGFPKSLNISKAIDKSKGKKIENKSEFTDFSKKTDTTKHIRRFKKCLECGKLLFGQNPCECEWRDYKGQTFVGKQWQGWGTALKPAVELIVLARKPISEKNIAENVLKWGTGGINIDGCRIEHKENLSVERNGHKLDTHNQGWGFKAVSRDNKGRFPANFIHDGSDEVISLFPNSKGASKQHFNPVNIYKGNSFYKSKTILERDYEGYNDFGSAARFFYCAKASTIERNKGLDRICGHPTVKPISLMRYLCRLITPPNGIVLDPFIGSGTTAIACKLEKFNYIGIELNSEYCEIAKKRLESIPNPLL